MNTESLVLSAVQKNQKTPELCLRDGAKDQGGVLPASPRTRRPLLSFCNCKVLTTTIKCFRIALKSALYFLS